MWNVLKRIFKEVLNARFWLKIIRSFGVLALFALLAQIVATTIKNTGSSIKDVCVQAYNATVYIYKNRD